MSTPLWRPSEEQIAASNMQHFLQYVNQQYQQQLSTYHELYQWSVNQLADFWQAIWQYMKIVASQPVNCTLTPADKIWQHQWFTGAKLNFAENLLRHCQQKNKVAIYYANETGERGQLSYADLYAKVASLAHYLKQQNIKPGDRVVGFLPNSPASVIAMLATTSIGAIWSCCSPDFGTHGLLDRFSQIQPKILLTTDLYYFRGKQFNHTNTIKELQTQLTSLQQTILVPYHDATTLDVSNFSNTTLFAACLNTSVQTIIFEQLNFNDPGFILYSSGTTGKPKCMVHGIGGVLLQHLKEHVLHTNLTADDTLFFYTTTGWMMWNWLISGLASGASIVLYEGAPNHPSPAILFDLIDEFNISIFGVGAKIIETAHKAELKPQHSHPLTSLKTILTTGSPLLPESFDYIYQHIKQDLCVSSISGGSDLVSCFALGNPILPVYRGELQCRGLGMKVEIFDDNGHSVTQQQGELVCTAPFPCMPIYFWNDADGSKYFHAYFDQFPNVWTHGDFAEITAHDGIIIYGRSDAVINPSGVRIGTAEIYQQTDSIPEIFEAAAVGQQWQGSERIILFVVMQPNFSLTDELQQKIRQQIRSQLSPMHMPAKIIAVKDLPRTLNGKLVEIAVKNLIHGKPVKNVDAIANPQALEYFKNIVELQS